MLQFAEFEHCPTTHIDHDVRNDKNHDLQTARQITQFSPVQVIICINVQRQTYQTINLKRYVLLVIGEEAAINDVSP